jgi:pilus assembly protein CpaE
MKQLTAAILASENEERAVLQMVADGTAVARTVYTSSAYPVNASDSVLRRIQEVNPEVLLVDIPSGNSSAALRSIELLHTEVPKAAIIAIGDLSQPHVIVSSMRAGAREFLERPLTTNGLLEAFLRLTSNQRKKSSDGKRGRVISVVNAKGGNGATTVAVNLALSLHALNNSAALLDVAPLGHAALHLNMRPTFTFLDAVRNLHRLDGALLESFMMRHPSGLHLLASPAEPTCGEALGSEFARLFDVLVTEYRDVVVDVSSRFDAATRLLCDLSDLVILVANTDVASLWSAVRVHQFLGDVGRDRARLVLNRFRKIPGFGESDAEANTGLKLLWTIPNYYAAVAASIDRGIPVVQQNHSEMARCFASFAAALCESNEDNKKKGWSLFKTA